MTRHYQNEVKKILRSDRTIVEISQRLLSYFNLWDLTRYRHKKRGSTYTVLAQGKVQISNESGSRMLREGDMLTVYRSDEDGTIWLRFPDEFNDGRFEFMKEDEDK